MYRPQLYADRVESEGNWIRKYHGSQYTVPPIKFHGISTSSALSTITGQEYSFDGFSRTSNSARNLINSGCRCCDSDVEATSAKKHANRRFCSAILVCSLPCFQNEEPTTRPDTTFRIILVVRYNGFRQYAMNARCVTTDSCTKNGWAYSRCALACAVASSTAPRLA